MVRNSQKQRRFCAGQKHGQGSSMQLALRDMLYIFIRHQNFLMRRKGKVKSEGREKSERSQADRTGESGK
jgi:hypothetical protein